VSVDEERIEGLHLRQACDQTFDPRTQHAQGFTQLGSLRLAPASTPYDPRSHHPSHSNPTTTARTGPGECA